MHLARPVGALAGLGVRLAGPGVRLAGLVVPLAGLAVRLAGLGGGLAERGSVKLVVPAVLDAVLLDCSV